MAKLVYSAIASLDGYVADGDGDFGWAVPDGEVHAFVNDLQRPIGTHLRAPMCDQLAGCNRPYPRRPVARHADSQRPCSVRQDLVLPPRFRRHPPP